MSTSTKTDAPVRTKIVPRDKVAPPPQYRVIYLNDEVTTVDFVVESLVHVFGHTPSAALDLAMVTHKEGQATVAVLPYEIAEQKGGEVILQARNAGYPLQVRIEQDT